jgi:hypothetical protein
MLHKQIDIVPFEYWHLSMIKPQQEQQSAFDYFNLVPNGVEAYGRMLEQMAVFDTDGEPCAWTALMGGNVVLCSGILRTQLHIGEAWALFDKRFFDVGAHNIRKCLDRIKLAMRTTDLKRIQCTTEVSFKRADLFLRKLGFEPEGIKRKYGINGEDHMGHGS